MQSTGVIRGVIFDLDGTLFDGDYDWPAIKRRLGVARADGTILEHLDALPPDQRQGKERLLREFEEHATKNGRLKPGAAQMLGDLRARGLKLALVTNNHLECVEQIVSRYMLSFDLVQTRESGLYKPSGAALLRAAHELGIDPEELVAVGDNELDNRAAHDAGMAVVIIINPKVEMFRGRCDHALRDLDELRELLGRLLPAAD
jgi:HAD superfamily hydrolase (TIGR01509 family)